MKVETIESWKCTTTVSKAHQQSPGVDDRAPQVDGKQAYQVPPSRRIGDMASTVDGKQTYEVYTYRWFMLAIVSSLNLSTSMNWITFAAAADTTVEFYKISTLQLNILSMCFVLVTIPVGLTAAWITDTYGLRITFLIAAWTNGIGSLLRNISAMEMVPLGYKYPVVLIGQICIACGEKFVMMIPTKLAAQWFPENRRAIANMLGGITDAVGIMVAFITVPLMVEDETDIPNMLWAISAPAFLITIATTLGVRRSKPPVPPSASAAQSSEPFIPGVKLLLKNKTYLILALCFGTGFAIYVSVIVMLEQSLCPRGYSDDFAGLCGALMIASGTIVAALASIYVDKTKKFDEVLKVSYCICLLGLIAFVQVSRLRDQHVWVAVTLVVFGGFALAIYPITLELAVEVTYPVAAATSSGICIISGSTQGIVSMFAMQYLAQPLPAWERHLKSGCLEDGEFIPQDFTYSYLWVANCTTVTALVVLVVLFRPKYKRLAAERKEKLQSKEIPTVDGILSTKL